MDYGRMFLPDTYGDEKLDPVATMNPQWSRWFDQMRGQAGGRGIKLRGGQSAKGSTQMRGFSQQPDQVSDPRADPMGLLGVSGMDHGNDFFKTPPASLRGFGSR